MSRLGTLQGAVVTRVLLDGWIDHGFCLRFVGGFAARPVLGHVAATGCEQIANALAISMPLMTWISHAKYLHRWSAGLSAASVVSPCDGGDGRLQLICRDTSAQHGLDHLK
jgi:hypothetical protein